MNIPYFKTNYIVLLPVYGMGIFIILYLIAAIAYPGGSWISLEQHGFSFWNNYLCDLLDYYAINGDVNMARFFARAALFALSVSLIALWFYLPILFLNNGKSRNLLIMKFSGILALVIILFLASGTHDLVIRIAGVFGVIAFVTCFIELYKNNFYRLFFFGLFCLIIFLGNYYIYETGSYLKSLPVIQKITFLSYIFWFAFLDITLYRKIKLNNKK